MTQFDRFGPSLVPRPPHPHSATTMEEASRFARDWTAWEMAEADAQREAQKHTLPSRQLKGEGPTVVVSVRLDKAEMRALERRCLADPDLKPSVLARQFIRRGLMAQDRDDLSILVEEALADLDEVRRRLGDAVE